MVRIEYTQETPSKIEFAVPGFFVVMGIAMMLYGYHSQGFSAAFIADSLVPAAELIIFVAICLLILRKQSNQRRGDVVRIKHEGYQVSGELLNVNTYTHTVRKANGLYQEHHYYTFTVRYRDPESGQSLTRESIRTHTYYQPTSTGCVLRVRKDAVLVEYADVVPYKSHWSPNDILLVCVFFMIIAVLLLLIVLPILKTL